MAFVVLREGALDKEGKERKATSRVLKEGIFNVRSKYLSNYKRGSESYLYKIARQICESSLQMAHGWYRVRGLHTEESEWEVAKARAA